MGDPMEQRDEAHDTIDDLRAAFVRARHALRTIVHSEWLSGSEMRQVAREALARLHTADAAPVVDPVSEAIEAQRFLAPKFEARCTELEATIESGRSMNAVLRTQLAEAKDEAATLRGQLSSSQQEALALRAQLAEAQDKARTLGESRPVWVTDGDARQLVVWRAVQQRVGVVTPDAHGGATWSVDANGHSASGHCPPGPVPEQAAERAQANVEAVAGVRP